MAYEIVTDGLVAKWEASDWKNGKTWTDSINGKVINFSSSPSSKTADGIEITTYICVRITFKFKTKLSVYI